MQSLSGYIAQVKPLVGVMNVYLQQQMSIAGFENTLILHNDTSFLI